MQIRMMMTAGTLAVALANPAHGSILLGSHDIVITGGFNTVFDTLPVKFMMSPDFNLGPIYNVPISGTSVIGASDVGTTWSINAPSVELVLDEFTDADMFGAIGVQITLFHPDGDSFGGWFIAEIGFASHGLDLDLIATQGDEIVVTLLAFSTVSPGNDINGDGIWTNYSMTFRYDFISIPAPGAASLLAAGGLIACRRRRRA